MFDLVSKSTAILKIGQKERTPQKCITLYYFVTSLYHDCLNNTCMDSLQSKVH